MLVRRDPHHRSHGVGWPLRLLKQRVGYVGVDVVLVDVSTPAVALLSVLLLVVVEAM